MEARSSNSIFAIVPFWLFVHLLLWHSQLSVNIYATLLL